MGTMVYRGAAALAVCVAALVTVPGAAWSQQQGGSDPSGMSPDGGAAEALSAAEAMSRDQMGAAPQAEGAASKPAAQAQPAASAPSAAPAPGGGEAPRPKRPTRKRGAVRPASKGPLAGPKSVEGPSVTETLSAPDAPSESKPVVRPGRPVLSTEAKMTNDPEETVKVSAFEGFVEAKQAGQPWKEVAKPGFALRPADRLHTYGDSRATLGFHEQSEAEVAPLSVFSVEKAKFDHLAVGIFQGKVSCKVSWRARRRFEVRAPGAAVMAKASEEFSVSATSDRRVLIEVTSGEVWVFAVGSKKQVKAGQRVEVAQGRMGEVEPIPAAVPPPPKKAEKKPEPKEPAGAALGPLDTSVPDRGKSRPKPAASEPLLAGPRDLAKALVEVEVQRSLAREAAETAAAFETRIAQYAEGKVLKDISGNRVRVEEYLVRPDPKTFKLITMNERQGRLDYGLLQVEANKPLPDDLSEAGSLFYRPGSAKPDYYAVKYLWTLSNSRDEFSQVGVDGDSLAIDITAGPVYDVSYGRYEAPVMRQAYQTFFGNVYEFVNGNAVGVNRIYSDAAFRPVDDGVTAGTTVSGMMGRLQPIEIKVRDAALNTLLATYYDYAYLVTSAVNSTGKCAVISYGAPDAYSARLLERRNYVNFRDTNGDGIMDFAENTEAGAGGRYGNAAVGDVYHDKARRLNGTVWANLNGAGGQCTDAGCTANAGDTQFFSDTDNDGAVDGGEPAVAIAGIAYPNDAALVAFAAANRREWLETESFPLDDRGEVAKLVEAAAGGTAAANNQTADVMERYVLERSITASRFGGRKIDLVLTPSLHFSMNLMRAEAGDSRAPSAGGLPVSR